MHKYTTRTRTPLLLAGLLVLTACASFVAPKTNLQRVAAADTQFAAAVNAAADLRAKGVIDDRQYRALTPAIDRGSQALDAAYGALASEHPDSALDYVRRVNQALLKINNRLDDHE